MSKPDLFPEQSAAGIAVDPRTLERVIPESRRPDGSLRKEKKIRPGYTPQEDVSRFRGSRQQQQERNALPKGHILGWVGPSSETKKTPMRASTSSTSDFPSLGMSSPASPLLDKPLSKSAAKNAKRKAKKVAEKEQKILENWDDDDDDVPAKPNTKKKDKIGEDGGTGQAEAVELAAEVLEAKGAGDGSESLPPEGAKEADVEQAGVLADELKNLKVG